ncbi:MAG: penicillin-binding protein 2 [Hallerella sp.]|jgi:penicillin-binding protein 2|nr:penicillin-binding protein 2 [Hallerella sp.]
MHNNRSQNELQSRNLKSLVFMAAVALVFSCLSVRLLYLQYVQYEKNLQSSEENRLRRIVLKAERGLIYDRNGTLLVGNRPSYQIVIKPAEIRKMKPEAKAELFNRLIHMKDSQGEAIFDSAVVDTMFQRSSWKGHGTLRILEDASEEQVSIVRERSFELPGVTTTVESRRSYPYGTLAAHLLGYTGEISDDQLERPEYAGYSSGDRVGQKGLEQQYDGEFRGEDGVKYVQVDAYGREVGTIDGMQNVPSVPGYGMVTTIDLDIQKAAEEAFPDSVRGAVVALDPRTGEILAMVSSPRLDPNIFSLKRRERNKGWAKVALDSTRPLMNRAVAGVYPPASVFKLVTSGAGLEHQLVTGQTHLPKPCTGGFTFGARYQKCWGTHGNLDLVNALRLSCDVYYYQLGLMLGMERINEFGSRFGLGHKLGVDIPGEKSGWLPDSVSFNARNKRNGWRWARGLILNLSIGQGQLVTPLQEAVLAGSIATGKGVFRPHLMKELRDVDGNVVGRYIPEKIFEGNMAESTRRTLLAGMDSVVNHPGGTGKRAALPDVRVGGKSGSGEWKKGEKTHAWFVAVAPLYDPEIAVAVLQEAQGGGGAKSAPVCRKVLEAYFAKKHPKDSTEVRP